MDEPVSKLEQLLIQLAEWRVRFLHERQWRESVEKDKKALEEKYSQVVFELGTQKRAVEELEARVALLSATTQPRAESGAGSSGIDEAGKTLSVQDDVNGEKAVKQEAERGSSGHERPSGDEKGNAPDEVTHDKARQNFDERPHHIYSNSAVYESSVAWTHGRRYFDHHKANRTQEEPYIFHRYNPDETFVSHDAPRKYPAEELNAVLDDEIASLQNGPPEA